MPSVGQLKLILLCTYVDSINNSALVVFTLTAKVISWWSITHMTVFPGFLTPVLTQLSFQSH